MLIRFSVENFSSFKERQTFSLIPGKTRLKKEHKTNPVNNISLLKTSVIFGANASGKSNLVKAIVFGKKLVLKGIKADGKIIYEKFKLDKNCLEGDSRIEYELQANGKNFAYGFVFNKNNIREEWLYEISRKNDKKIFERNSSDFDLSFFDKNNSKEEQKFLEFIAKSTPDNQLFLHEIRTRKVKENVSDITELLDVLDWFLNTLKVIRPDDKYKMGLRFELKEDKKLLQSFEEFLKYFDTGIDGVCLQQVSIEEMDIPKRITEKILDDLGSSNLEKSFASMSINDVLYFISVKNNKPIFHKFMTRHKTSNNSEELFDTSEESDGTNRIIDFIPLFMDLLQGNNVFIIDEMERSLHPNLIYDLLDLFLKKSEKVNSQLILTSHESSLLTQKLLRKDEVWFTVKTKYGSTKVYSLEEYNVRFDKAIRRDYLLGRFKAIPKIGSRSKLTVLPNQ